MSDNDCNGDVVDDVMNIIFESMQQCTHCGIRVDPSLNAGSCPFCNKFITGGLPSNASANSICVDYSELSTSANAVYKLAPNYCIVSNAPRSAPQNNAPDNVSDEQAQVLEEFMQLLLDNGYDKGKKRDGAASKYCGYMQMLFDGGIFSRRADFFKCDSRARAHRFYMQCAQEKASNNQCKTSARKMYTNFVNGFDKFVLLSGFDAVDDAQCVTVQDIIDIIG